VLWRVVGTGSAVLAATAAQKVLSMAWRAATGDDPPTIPEDPDTEWKDAVAWALLSGAVIGLARLFATRRAAIYYRRSTGELPAAMRRET
jgi:transposase